MSEIYSPGSIAGPQGPTGPAGSAAAVSALSSALIPTFVGRNMFNSLAVTPGALVNAADGTLIVNGSEPTDATGLIYCAGATSMITNLQVGYQWGCGISLYDANGTFISTSIPGSQIANAAYALPGTQTYVRFGVVPSWMATGFEASLGMVYFTVGGTATLPGTYQSFGFETPADVNVKDAVVAATAAANLAASLTSAVNRALNAALPVPPFSNAINLFNPNNSLQNKAIRADGTYAPDAGTATAVIYCPGATGFITNMPVRGPLNGYGFGLFDANGNWMSDISAALPYSGAFLVPNAVYVLPGTQTYVQFEYSPSDVGFQPNECLFFAGTAANPCIASLPASAPVLGGILPSATVKTTTQLGCIYQPNYNGIPYDNAAVLNAFLQTASATNPIKLVLDHMVPTTALTISPAGYTTIEGLGQGTGLSMMPGPACSIYTGAPGVGSYSATPPARAMTNLAFRNFTVATAFSGTPTPLAMPAYLGIYIADCSDVVVENVKFTGPTCSNDFMLTIANANRVFVRGCSFFSTGVSHDGVHVDGLCEDIAISDCYFATGDDAIALNAPEGWGGDISRVTVTNCIFDGSLTVMRIYTSLDLAAMPTKNVHHVRNVVVSNCSGWVNSVCFNLGITNGGLSSTADVDQIHDLTVSNCSLAAPQGLALLLASFGSLVFSNIAFTPMPGASALINCCITSVGECVLDNVRILRNPDGNAVMDAFVYLYSGLAMDRVTLINCRAVDEEGSSYAAHTSLIDCNGAIATLRLEAIDMTHIAALWGTGGTTGIASMVGHGVIGTGVVVPDSIMGNNALYLSSNASGAPSIKVGGTAKRLTLT